MGTLSPAEVLAGSWQPRWRPESASQPYGVTTRPCGMLMTLAESMEWCVGSRSGLQAGQRPEWGYSPTYPQRGYAFCRQKLPMAHMTALC